MKSLRTMIPTDWKVRKPFVESQNSHMLSENMQESPARKGKLTFLLPIRCISSLMTWVRLPIECTVFYSRKKCESYGTWLAS
ncbi:hypothetical protein EUGRSUZ_K03206 [Eucalyptus grandis]|uniref:Uncharacterized protein n=2 Tax=Eucalyptus grandis TaxID=71139 RepID=A0ACC3J1K7_EUCGR|nr:hypothetical protein EUGRSUZ_K03206 [Eucalyptus grandis]